MTEELGQLRYEYGSELLKYLSFLFILTHFCFVGNPLLLIASTHSCQLI